MSYDVAPVAFQLRVGVVVPPTVALGGLGVPGACGAPAAGADTGVGVGDVPVNCIRSKLPTDEMPMVSITRRAVCTPAPSVTLVVMVCPVCQPPVLGTVREPVTFRPFISRWNVPPDPDEATRN